MHLESDTRYGKAELILYLKGDDLLIFGNGIGLRYVEKHLSKAPMERIEVNSLGNRSVAELLIARGYGKKEKQLSSTSHWINTAIVGVSLLILLFRAGSSNSLTRSSAVFVALFVLTPAVIYRILVFARKKNSGSEDPAWNRKVSIIIAVLVILTILARVNFKRCGNWQKSSVAFR